jgi:polyhydroxyalkanoate synthesis regulator phasin
MIKKQKEKKVTIDRLAIMIEEGFSAMAKQTDLLALTARVDRLESRLGIFEKSVDVRFDAVFSELKEIRKEIKVNNLKTEGNITSLDFRVGKLEKKLPS